MELNYRNIQERIDYLEYVRMRYGLDEYQGIEYNHLINLLNETEDDE